MEKRYNLIRSEVQELFAIGKSHKTNPDVDQEVLHTRLAYLTHPAPYLQPRQMRWWLDLCYHTNTKAPLWLLEASVAEI